jgi:hypothetical protein
MNENLSTELLAWLTQAGLGGTSETDIVSVFCDRCVTAGIPLGRAHVAIDTLHPVHEGRLLGLDVSGAPTNSANVKISLANSEPSTHGRYCCKSLSTGGDDFFG